jgi:uncharacterized protein YgbK (DUF1537 family)
MPTLSLHVLADDLSGAAECAAAVACRTGRPVPLVLKGPWPPGGNWSADTDSRAMPEAAAAEVAACGLRAAGGGRAIVYKKIDSTLRGHVAAELRAMLAVHDTVDAVVVCPSLPAQGRTLANGVLHIHGAPQLDGDSRPVDLLDMLGGTGTAPLLLRPARGTTATGLAAELVAAVRSGRRILVVDAAEEGELRRLARALIAASGDARLLPAGAAAFAQAMAGELFGAREGSMPAPPPSCDGPWVALAGSFNAVTGRQVDELASQPGVHLVRLAASSWLSRSDRAACELTQAAAQAAQGKSIVLAVSGPAPVESTRELVRRIADAAEPLLRSASMLLLTGGDTARTVLDRLGIDRLEVLGEIEPGISFSRCGVQGPSVVTKAGGFGDDQTLVRVLQRFAPTLNTHPALESDE